MTTSAPRTESLAIFCSRRRAGRAGPVDPAICTLGRRLDPRHRSRSLHVRHPFAAPDQGHADLPPHGESSRGPAIIAPFQDRLCPAPNYVPLWIIELICCALTPAGGT